LKLKILNKLRTASLNSEFTGSYKKMCSCCQAKTVFRAKRETSFPDQPIHFPFSAVVSIRFEVRIYS